MKNVMLSIQPVHFNKILSGEKIFEFRKVLPADISRIYFYVSAPVKKVSAYLDMPHVLKKEKEQLWETTHAGAGIEKVFFDEYFAKKEIALAIEINNLVVLDEPKTLKDFGIEFSPQNFCFIKNQSE